jgi:16S rRNA G966 N2-methylase RsmD
MDNNNYRTPDRRHRPRHNDHHHRALHSNYHHPYNTSNRDHHHHRSHTFTAEEEQAVKQLFTQHITPEHGQLQCPVDVSLQLAQANRSLVQSTFAALVRDQTLTFPYKRYHLLQHTNQTEQSMLSNLRNHVPEVDTAPFTVPGFIVQGSADWYHASYQAALEPDQATTTTTTQQYLTFVSSDADYHTIDSLTDLYTEEQRMNAYLKDYDSPLKTWQIRCRNIIDRVLQAVLRGNAASTTTSTTTPTTTPPPHATEAACCDSYQLREAVYCEARECTQFKASLTRAVIQHFGAKRLLDFSAGWGDRLIGAIGANVDRYVGVDPNTELQVGHNRIIQQLAGPLDAAKFSIIYDPFQTAELSAADREQGFDLVFTSPPYFSFEIYSHDERQSVSQYRGFMQWMLNFLFVSLHKAWQVLNDLGHLAIHISDTRGAACCELMNLFIQSELPDSCYKGVIGARAGSKSATRPMWVWQRNNACAQSNARIERRDAARRVLRRRIAHDVHLVPDSLAQLREQ